jgi:hypothetical protein
MKNKVFYFLSAYIIIYLLLFTAKAFSQTSQNTDTITAYERGITSGRARALAIVVVGIISVVLAFNARKSTVKVTSNSRNKAIVALTISILTIVLSNVHLITSAGAVFGSGSGKAGAIVALFLGFTGTVLSGVALRKNGR